MRTEEIDLRTPLQKKRQKRNERIFKEYTGILNNPPQNATKWAIWRAIGDKYGLKAQGVRTVINKMQKNTSNVEA